MPARNRNPIQISRVSLACLALLVAVCGGYFALVPFLKAIEPSPSIGEAAHVKGSSVTVQVVTGVTVDTTRKPGLVSNQLRPKTTKASKPKKPVAKKKPAVTVPTRSVLVNNPVRPPSSSTPTHTSTAPTHTQSTPTPTTKKPVAPSRNRPPVVGITSGQGSGLAGRGSGSGQTVTGGVSSTPGH
jgi:hypothetical protein